MMDPSCRRSLWVDLLNESYAAWRRNPPKPTITAKEPKMPPKLPPDVKAATIDAVAAAFTEERTDALIAKFTSGLPWWARWFPLAAILDRLLPGVLLEWLDESL